MPDRNEDRFTRNSFTFRRMQRWQVWTLAIIAIVLLAMYLAVR